MDEIIGNLKAQETLIGFELQSYNNEEKEELVKLAELAVNEAIQYLEELQSL